MPTMMLVELEDGSWRVLADTGTAFRAKADALESVVQALPAGSPSPLVMDCCPQPEHRHRGRQVKAIVHHFAAPETTHEVKAKNLRVGYGVWAEGTSSRIHKVSRHHPDNPGQVVAFTEWGRIAYDPDELVKVSAPVLHPRIVDDKNQEIGVGSMIKGGDSDAGELVEFTEPDESHWGVLVKWPEFDEPERFEASPNDPSEDPLYCTDVEAI